MPLAALLGIYVRLDVVKVWLILTQHFDETEV